RPNIIILATQKNRMSYAVMSTLVGEKSRRSAVSSGQPSVENGHSAEENQVSRTSGSCVQPAGAVSSGPTQRASPSGPYQTGIRCPHQSWREMHQSCMSSTQPKYLAFISGGEICTRPSRTASPAAFASGATFTNHCSDSRGSTVVEQREQ